MPLFTDLEKIGDHMFKRIHYCCGPTANKLCYDEVIHGYRGYTKIVML